MELPFFLFIDVKLLNSHDKKKQVHDQGVNKSLLNSLANMVGVEQKGS